MTLVIALKWVMEDDGKEAVLMTSDSKVTWGPISYEAKKIHPVFLGEVPIAIAGGSGDAAMVKYGYSVVDSVVREFMKGEKRTPSYEEFREIVSAVEKTLIARFRELRSMGIDVSFNMILASVDLEGRASIYHFDSRGLAEPVHDNPGFAMIGCGSITGGMLLLKLLGYEPKTPANLGVLTSFIIDMVSEIDPAVGPFIGESWLMRVEEGEVFLGPVKEDALREFKEKTRKRRELIKLLNLLCDVVGEDKVEKALVGLFGEVEKDGESGGED